jgi:hypothetical protein
VNSGGSSVSRSSEVAELCERLYRAKCCGVGNAALPVAELCERLFRAKEERRRHLAQLPFEEKVRILVELQKMAYETRTAAGLPCPKPWDLPG